MSAMAAKRQEVVGKDQDGRDVYADKSVVVPVRCGRTTRGGRI